MTGPEGYPTPYEVKDAAMRLLRGLKSTPHPVGLNNALARDIGVTRRCLWLAVEQLERNGQLAVIREP